MKYIFSVLSMEHKINRDSNILRAFNFISELSNSNRISELTVLDLSIWIRELTYSISCLIQLKSSLILLESSLFMYN